MKDKGHFYISLFKSILRIIGCIFAVAQTNSIYAMMYLASFFIAAEVFGVCEEIADQR